jgi:hypothetical protein
VEEKKKVGSGFICLIVDTAGEHDDQDKTHLVMSVPIIGTIPDISIVPVWLTRIWHFMHLICSARPPDCRAVHKQMLTAGGSNRPRSENDTVVRFQRNAALVVSIRSFFKMEVKGSSFFTRNNGAFRSRVIADYRVKDVLPRAGPDSFVRAEEIRLGDLQVYVRLAESLAHRSDDSQRVVSVDRHHVSRE